MQNTCDTQGSVLKDETENQLLSPYAMFRYSIRSELTRKYYERRLRKFLDFIEFETETKEIEKRCDSFAEKGKDNNWTINQIIRFLQFQKERVEKEEITGATLKNFIKSIKIFCDSADIDIPWKKVTRGLPKGRQAANDRAPTLEEIRRLVRSEEVPYKESSWSNQQEALACAKICKNLVKIPALTQNNSIVIITRFTGQVIAIRNLLAQMGLLDNYNIKVTTTTTALGTQGDIVLFSLVRNNQDKTLGALTELPDLNVSISRAKKKLIIVGSFDMMVEGHGDRRRSKTNYAHNLAKLVESRYGKVIEVPEILR